MKGKEKDSCFRQVIGFSHSTLRNEASKNQENVRNYVVLVLYDLQEKVEEEHAAGKLTDEQAATLIDKIVSTKQTILQGKTKAEIRAALDDLKTTWKSVMTQ